MTDHRMDPTRTDGQYVDGEPVETYRCVCGGDWTYEGCDQV